jgi:hypothetical protein
MADKKLTKDQEADEIVGRLKHGTGNNSLENYIVDILSEEIRREIDKEVLDKLLRDI